MFGSRKSKLKEEFGEFFLPEHKGVLHLFERNGEIFLVVSNSFNINSTNYNNSYSLKDDHLGEFLGTIPIKFNCNFVELNDFYFSNEELGLLRAIGAKPSISYFNTGIQNLNFKNKSYKELEITVGQSLSLSYGAFRLNLHPNDHSNTFNEDIELCKKNTTIIVYDEKEFMYFVKH